MLVLAHMGKLYGQLTSQERDLIGILLAEGKSPAEISRRLGRNKSTISRELTRNGPRIRKAAYFPHKANERARSRRQSTHVLFRMKEDQIRDYVITKLKKKWSPELISGRLSIEHHDLHVSHETIYRWIYSEGKEYRIHLAQRHTKRKKRGSGRKSRKFNISQRVSIDDRPENINNRKEAGHWEVDTAFFYHCKEVLQVMAERKTRYTMLTKINDITAQEMRMAMLHRLDKVPENLKKSFTYDNGRENTCHVYVNNCLGASSYFCNPGHCWEKGTVENTIGIVRRLLPKKSKFEMFSTSDLKTIENWLNDRPRKCLKFKTPKEAYLSESCT